MPSITFALKFFWRDFKSDRTFNYFFLLCASLGIIGLLLVESFKGGVEEKVSNNAKKFIASDLLIANRHELAEADAIKVEDYIKQYNLKYARWVETYSLVTNTSSTEKLAKLTDLNFVSTNFPFYGGVAFEDKKVIGPGSWQALHTKPLAWVSRDLAWGLNAKVGDKLKIGEMEFVIDGIIIDDQFSSFKGFNLAPKIFISYQYIKQTDLIKFGSTATFSYAIKLPDTLDPKDIVKDLRKILPEKSIKIMGPEESSKQISRSLNILSDYLSLITLMTYLLSLVGLYYFTQHFLSKKIKVLSIYKAIGLQISFLFKVSFIHLFSLTFFAVVISSAGIYFILPLLQTFFSNLVGDDILFRLRFISMLRILALSVGGSMLSLGPLFGGALQVPVATLFQDLPAELKRIKFYYFIPLLTYVIILTIILANSYKVGGYFLGALSLILIISAIVFKFITVLLVKFAKKFNFVNRHAVLTLGRYFTSSFTIFICLLIGMTLTIFILQLENSLRGEFTSNSFERRPDIFMFDLQDVQAESFQKLLFEEKWKQPLFAPMVRARLIKINQEVLNKGQSKKDGDFTTREEESSEQMKNRGVNLSYRPKLSWSETVVDGKFNGEKCLPDKGICEISLEQNYAKRLGIKLGDKLSFDVSGIEITGVVTSTRTVKWMSFEPNFFILFQPGVLDEAPKTFLSSFKTNTEKEKNVIYTKIASAFPNVSILDVSEIVKKMTSVFDLMAIAIKFISILSLFVALIVLVAVSFNHLELRKKDMTLYFMLGVSSQIIRKIFVREFLYLILFCIVLSLVLGSLLSLLLMKYIFDTEALLRLPHVISLMILLGIVLYLIVSARVKSLTSKIGYYFFS